MSSFTNVIQKYNDGIMDIINSVLSILGQINNRHAQADWQPIIISQYSVICDRLVAHQKHRSDDS